MYDAYKKVKLLESNLKETLISYMKRKNEFLSSLIGKDLSYFSEEDEDLFSSFSLEELDLMISSLKNNIVNNLINEELTLIDLIGAHLCPFCIQFSPNLCSYCPYGKRKGICFEENSVYIKKVKRGLIDFLNEERISLEDELKIIKRLLRELSDILSENINCIHIL